MSALACAYEFGDWDRLEALKLHVDQSYGLNRTNGEAYYTLNLEGNEFCVMRPKETLIR